MAKKQTYGLGEEAQLQRIAAPDLPYRPLQPSRRPKIALIACGGITEQHLKAYRNGGYDVVALCDSDRAKAEARRSAFYPRASVHDGYRQVLKRDDIEVVDIAAHPDQRVAIVRAALQARKHVLSQKPFVLDLSIGHRLCDLAERNGVLLAVNQNGRWAPHFSYIRCAVAAGLIGRPIAAHLSVHWNHNWIAGTRLEQVRHIVLYDFAIHWFDMLGVLLPGLEPRRVFATCAASPCQQARPPLLGQALVEYDHAQASLAFDADARFGPQDRTYVAGSAGSITSVGPSLMKQSVTLYTAKGYSSPRLKGAWFPDGFHGAMAELLCAIEENRQPSNNARDNLTGLALCFAAVASADCGKPRIPGSVRRLPG